MPQMTMPAQTDEASVASRLGAIFTGQPAPEKAQAEPEAAPAAEDQPQEEAVEASEAESEGVEAEATETAEDEPEYEITHDGKAQRLKLSELREYAQKGYDYTTKTQAVSAEREAVAQARAALQQQQQIMTALQDEVMERHLAAKALEEASKVDLIEMAQTDPLAALQQQIRVQQAQQKFAAADAKLRESAQKWQQAQAQHTEAHLQQELARVQERIPEWRNESKRAEEAKAIRDYLASEGFTKEEIGSFSDHRALLMARKAWKFDQLQKAKPAVQKRSAEAPKLVSSTGQTTAAEIEQKKIRASLKKTGSVDDAARLLAARFK